MSTMEKIEKNKVKLTFSVDAARFEEGMQYSYNKNKGNIAVQGFRKGKAPRKLIEAQYGKAVFYDDAINFVMPEAYETAVKENNLDVVSRPEIDVTAIDENGVSFTAEVYTKPEVKLGEYKGLKYTKMDEEPTDEEIDAELKKEQEKNARIVTVTDRPVQDGDIATIDFKGFMDGEAFEGGEGKDFDLEIGSHSFIDTFEDQLVGKNVGDDVEVNVTFPENYGQASLAGKPAKFEVEIKDIKVKELPELNDEFVQDTTEFENLNEYKNEIAGKLIVAKKQQAKNKMEEDLVTALVEGCEMDVPQVMIDNDIDMKIEDFSRNIQSQGLSLDVYLQYMGQTVESMREAYRPMSEKQVKARLALEAVANAENFTVEEADLEAEVEKIAKAYGMEKDVLKSALRPEDTENITKDIKVQKAVQFIKDNAVEA
ncbi:MAG: trigger factor [Clostridia bacterium]|jgi:trigger factor|nr:trigger factor [Clostridia bacterium]